MSTFTVNKKYRPRIGKLQAVCARTWTDSAIMCYERGCICQGCIYKSSLKSVQCRMKVEVIELVRTIGLPKNVKTKGILENE